MERYLRNDVLEPGHAHNVCYCEILRQTSNEPQMRSQHYLIKLLLIWNSFAHPQTILKRTSSAPGMVITAMCATTLVSDPQAILKSVCNTICFNFCSFEVYLHILKRSSNAPQVPGEWFLLPCLQRAEL